jgi:hypothetical protein
MRVKIMTMKFDARSLAEALAGPWAGPKRRAARLALCLELPAELRAFAEQHERGALSNFLPKTLDPLEAQDSAAL